MSGVPLQVLCLACGGQQLRGGIIAVAATLGTVPASVMVYIVIVSVLVCAWNVMTATRRLHRFSRLNGDLQNRIVLAVTSKIGTRELWAIALPATLLLALGVARCFIGATG